MKLVKNNVVGAFGDKQVRWMIQEDIKHIVSGGWVIKCGSHGWKAFDGDGKWVLGIGYKNSKKAIIEAIYEYSDLVQKGIEEDARLEAEEDKKRAVEKAYGEFKKLELLMGGDENKEFKVGDFIQVDMGSMSKPNNIADYFESLYSWARVNRVNAKIEKVIELSNEDYDIFIEDFWSGCVAQMVNAQFVGGGSASDAKELDGADYMSIVNKPELMEIFRNSSYEIVNVIVSKNRKPIVVNPEGYNYPRYVGFAV